MSFTADSAVRPSLVDRAKNIILKPSTEWDRIDGEPTGVNALFTGYAMILAAIGPVCSAIGMTVFGVGAFGVSIHASPVGAIASAIVGYVLNLAGVFILGLIINALAPTFGGAKNQTQAMKVAVYSSTASWLAGVFGIFPLLGVLGILGLYSFYLLYLGLPKLMKTPQDKALGYTALVVVCAIVVAILIGVVTGPLRMMGAMGGALTTPGVTVTGNGGSVSINNANLAALQASAEAMAAQAKAVEAQANGATAVAGAAVGAAVVSADALKSLLPASLAGFTRGEVSAESGGVGGVNASHARAEYARGASHMTLEVSDAGGMAALAGLAGALGVNSSRETATGYERVSSSNGRTVSEEYDRESRHGKISVVSGRGIVEAQGENVTMDELKAAVGAVDPARIAALAKG